MSYCRCSEDSDVYVYGDINGGWELNFCVGKEGMEDKLKEHNLNSSYHFNTLTVLDLFLATLTLVGFKVPQHTFERIKRELAE